MNKFLLLLLLTIITFQQVHGQTVTLHAQVVFPNAKDTLQPIRFQINNHAFGEKDTVIQLSINSKGLDSCSAIIAYDTLHFLTKFNAGETYEIKQGCCCAAFTLEPTNNPRRGTVALKNTTKRDLGLVVAEANVDTVKAKTTFTTFSYESAMCMFKPCSILITEIDYLSAKYDYHNDKRNYDSLWQEQAQFILTKNWFHFLHGEKVVIVYNDKNKTARLEVNGYMTEEEYENIWK